MRKLILLTILGFGISQLASATSSKLPRKFNLKSLTKNKTMKYKDISSDTTVLQFWASWCTGCSKNMKAVASLQRKMKSDYFKFVPISVDETKEEALSYFDDKPKSIKRFKGMSYLDVDTKLASTLDVGSLPALVVIDKDGNVVKKMQGVLTKSEIRALKKTLKKAGR